MTINEDGYSELVLTPLDKYEEHRRLYELKRDFHYRALDGTVITVPMGYMTDLASVPRAFQAFVPKDGRILKAAVVHDYMYTTAMFGDKRIADNLLKEGMIRLGVKPWRRVIIYHLVKWFGRGNYPK